MARKRSVNGFVLSKSLYSFPLEDLKGLAKDLKEKHIIRPHFDGGVAMIWSS
jgi:hypothetical protein